MSKRLLIVGGGFAGVAAAMAAARYRHLLGCQSDLEIQLINPSSAHGIRVRYYEKNLAETQVDLLRVLEPLNITLIVSEVTNIDPHVGQVTLDTGQLKSFDSLVLASGSQLVLPELPGLKQLGFNVDSYPEACRLREKLEAFGEKANVVIVGAGFTGLELACELAIDYPEASITLIDRGNVGSALGDNPRSYIEERLKKLKIRCVSQQQLTGVHQDIVVLKGDIKIPCNTLIWCGGVRANPLTSCFNAKKNNQGRLILNKVLSIPGYTNCFAAGDVGVAKVDGNHDSLMTCQHGRPQGRIAGHNAVAFLYKKNMLDYQQPDYVNILDLGGEDALYMEGWKRTVVRQGESAKKTKKEINCQRIYPPLNGNISELFDAGTPVIQTQPSKYDD
ncbi:NAD(P)/FAD-dependent oxidoreductase [Dongshaea marina]|uniref:NAD(P)/FAD-dependent oxidoreductase n=1 Tax=Dongshaea marina TaxID=2047966 RepID=UPI000D3E468A|nr:FAD-dependent oxidoreductase [Dongshaea marina]